MKQDLPLEQVQISIDWFFTSIRRLSLIGVLISLPLVFLSGIGFITLLPLLVFFIFTKKVQKAIRLRKKVNNPLLAAYVLLTLLCCVACMYDFYLIGSIGGIDVSLTLADKFFRVALTSVAPFITILILRNLYRWNNSLAKYKTV